ncbi:MAG: protein-L-isoaspartate O-methyltransferase family protein [Caulobacteraceae bacterium]
MTFDFAAARHNMVESQVRPSDVTDYDIQDAMRVIRREALVPADKASLAYGDVEIEYTPGRYLMRPREVAKLLQALAPKAGERALAISAPYAARVIETIGLEVEQVDAADAPPAGEFDVIVSEGAVTAAPQTWIERLAPGGRLAVVERDGRVGRARLHLRTSDGTLASRYLFDAQTSLLHGFEVETGFVF